MKNKLPWKPITELPDRDCCDEVELKMKSGEIIQDVCYDADTQTFAYMFGNYYHVKKENEFREYNICEDRYWGGIATHYRITPPEHKEGE